MLGGGRAGDQLAHGDQTGRRKPSPDRPLGNSTGADPLQPGGEQRREQQRPEDAERLAQLRGEVGGTQQTGAAARAFHFYAGGDCRGKAREGQGEEDEVGHDRQAAVLGKQILQTLGRHTADGSMSDSGE